MMLLSSACIMPSFHPNPEDDSLQRKRNEDFEEVHATQDDVVWVQDPKSYITIMPYPKRGKIMARIYSTRHEKLYLVDGDTPQQVYHKILDMGLVQRLEHAAYLGKELYKAFVALQHHLHYTQDDPLDFDKLLEPIPGFEPKKDLTEFTPQ